jgi:hypothetical protein
MLPPRLFTDDGFNGTQTAILDGFWQRVFLGVSFRNTVFGALRPVFIWKHRYSQALQSYHE